LLPAFEAHGGQNGTAIRRAWVVCDSDESRHWPPVAREDDILTVLSPFHEVGEQPLSVTYGYVHTR
jgi:hypothetical protein